MISIRQEISKRIHELATIIKPVEASLKKGPQGKLRVNSSRSVVQYYHVTQEGQFGRYLKKNQEALIRALAQKEYNLSLIHI